MGVSRIDLKQSRIDANIGLSGIFTTASTNLIYAQTLGALIAVYHEDLVLKTWEIFIIYQGLNLLTAAVVMFGNKAIPALNKFSLFYLQIGWLVVLVTVVACAPSHRSTEFVFRTWINNTGWKNSVLCFITGLVNPSYSLGGLDGITHITEEMPNVSRHPTFMISTRLDDRLALTWAMPRLLSHRVTLRLLSALPLPSRFALVSLTSSASCSAFKTMPRWQPPTQDSHLQSSFDKRLNLRAVLSDSHSSFSSRWDLASSLRSCRRGVSSGHFHATVHCHSPNFGLA